MPSNIQDVWAYNFASEDTEFPGIIARPVAPFRHWLSYSYAMVSQNVNMLKLIQLGITLYNEKGETPVPVSTWQFNFKFCLDKDMYAPDSIQLLLNSGFDFKKSSLDGIDHKEFAEMITMSGLVLNDDVKWICFHGAYDFAYLLKKNFNKSRITN